MGSKHTKETDNLGLWDSAELQWGMGLDLEINDLHQVREYGRKNMLEVSQIDTFHSTC